MKVLDFMTENVITTTPGETLKDAARKMITARVSGLPVVDEGNHVIGIITEADFLEREAERDRTPGLLDALFHRRDAIVEAEIVGEVMTERPVLIHQDSSLAAAARSMAKHGVKRLPVVDADGVLLGVISRADIVNAFARPDEVLEDIIREDIVKRILWEDPGTVDIKVHEGVVTLGGRLETKSEATFFVELVERVEGVVRVHSNLRWKIDDTKPSTPTYV